MSTQVPRTTGRITKTAAQPIPFSLCSTTRPVLSLSTAEPFLPLPFVLPCLSLIAQAFLTFPFLALRFPGHVFVAFDSKPMPSSSFCRVVCSQAGPQISFSFLPFVFIEKNFLWPVTTHLRRDF